MGLSNSNSADGSYARAATELSNQNLKIEYNEKSLTVKIAEPNEKVENLDIYIDADGDVTTGVKSTWLWQNNGADFLIQRVKQSDGSFVTTLHKASENKGWSRVSEGINCEVNDKTVELKVSFDDLELKPLNMLKLGVGYISYTSGWNTATIIPAAESKYVTAYKELADGAIRVAHTEDNLFVRIAESNQVENFSLYIDANKDNSCSLAHLWENGKANILIQKVAGSNTNFFVYGNSNWNLRKYLPENYEFTCADNKITLKNNEIIYAIPYSFFEGEFAITASDVDSLGFAYQSNKKGWTAQTDDTSIPALTTPFARLAKNTNGSEGSGSGSQTGNPENQEQPVENEFKGGVIIPAYIDCSEANAEQWKKLADYAGKVTNAGKDFYVVISGYKGPANFKFENTESYLKPIQDNGGKIIAYVHTCNSTDGVIAGQKVDYAKFKKDGKYEYYEFRNSSEVTNEIAQWYDNLNQKGLNLDGIWFDEYYPRYELMTDSDPNDWKDIFPFINGLDNAPNEVCKLNSNGEKIETNTASLYDQWGGFAAIKNPEGGYYWKIYNWMMTEQNGKYKNLIKIGNAGGTLGNNQLEYGKLVDIIVSYEDSYKNADLIQPDGKKKLEYCFDEAGNSKYKMALIHSIHNSDEMKSAIDRAINKGYSYVYVTSLDFGGNLWGELPNYFDDEVAYIAPNN
ncbi:MAG: hypothetical protein J6X84_04385 [Treponema sp.]|nr:hypothetical protein [Treponema sp.]